MTYTYTDKSCKLESGYLTLFKRQPIEYELYLHERATYYRIELRLKIGTVLYPEWSIWSDQEIYKQFLVYKEGTKIKSSEYKRIRDEIIRKAHRRFNWAEKTELSFRSLFYFYDLEYKAQVKLYPKKVTVQFTYIQDKNLDVLLDVKEEYDLECSALEWCSMTEEEQEKAVDELFYHLTDAH